MAALLILRCMTLNNTKHTWMAMNVNHCGAFDDLILYRETKDGNVIIYFIQLKHENKETPIKVQQFLTKKDSPVLLQKYFDSILEIMQESQKGVKPQEKIEDVIDCLWFNRNKIVFALFTNRGCNNKYDFIKDVARKSDLDHKWLLYETIDTGGKIGEFDYKNLNTKFGDDAQGFMERFFLFTKQLHVSKLDGAISNAIKSFIKPTQVSKEVLETMVTKFISFVTDWSKGLLGGYYALTEHHAAKKIVEFLLEAYMVKLNKPVDKVIPQPLWGDLIMKREITIVNNAADEVVERFFDDFFHECITKRLMADKSCDEEQLLKLVATRKVVYEDVYDTLWKAGELPVLVQINNSQAFRQIQNILKIAQGIFKVILLNKTDTLLEKLRFSKLFVHIGDLEPHQRDQILNIPVKLQGRNHFLLKGYVRKDMAKYITAKDIIYILRGKFSLGQEFEALPDFFIKRALGRICLGSEVLQKVQEDIFVVQCKSMRHFKLFIEQHALDISEERINHWHNGDKITAETRIIVSDNASDLREIEAHSFKRPVHYLWQSDHDLEWIRSSDTTHIKQLRKSGSAKVVMAEEIIRDACTRKTPILLNACPGMGKSVLIDYFARAAPTDYWVLKINLPAYKKMYTNWRRPSQTDESFKAFLEQVLADQAYTNLTRAVFQRHLHSKNVIFLLDGFDEITLDYQMGAKNLVKFLHGSGYLLCVTTRPVLKNDLESVLGTFAMSLKPFSRLNQEYFLANYFAKGANVSLSDPKLKSFVGELLSAAKNNLNDRDGEFLGVPLQTTLLASVFLDDCLKYFDNGVFENKHFDLVYLYKTFMEKKIQIAFEKCESTSEDMIKQYRIFRPLHALHLLFSESDLIELKIEEQLQMGRTLMPDIVQLIQKDGVVVAENETCVKFVHQTFAEYLAAEWLAVNINGKYRETALVLVRRTFDPSLIVVRSIFDRITCQDCPLHLAIMNHNIGKVKNIISSVNLDETDEAGRTLLHVIASWGLYHPKVFTTSITLRMAKEDDMISIIKLIPDDKLRFAKDDLDYTPLDYAYLSRSLNVANAIYSRLLNISHPIPVSRKGVDVILDYCAELNYASLVWGLRKGDSSQKTNYSDEMLLAVSDGDIEKVRLLATTMPTLINELGEDGLAPLHIAAKHGHLETIQLLLSIDAEINAKDKSGKSALHWAARSGHTGIATLLISRGIDLSVLDEGGISALHYAIGFCSNNQYETVAALLDGHPPPNFIDAQDKSNMTALHWAAETGQITIADLLLSKGAAISATCIGNNTALHLAARNGHVDLINQLLTKGADVACKTDSGMTPLHNAAYNDHVDAVQLLLSKGANAKSKDRLGGIALHLAASYGQAETVKMLLPHSDIENKDNEGCTALLLAARNNYVDTADLLLAQGADLETRDNQEGTSLHWAAHNGHEQMVNLLLTRGAVVDVRESQSVTPLHWAINNGHIEVVKLLVSKGATVDARDNHATTPLLWAVYHGHTDILNLLHSEGAVIDAVDDKQMTALIVASRAGHTDIVNFVLDNGANIEAKDNEATTSLHWAANNGRTDVVNLLLSRGAFIDARDDKDMTALHSAAGNGHVNVANSILSEGFDIETTTNDNITALILAAEQGQVNMIRFLLSKGAKINAREYQAKTALHYAACNGHKECVDLLISKGATIDATDLQDMSALHWAVHGNHTEIVDLLLSSGANIEAKNIKGATPLHWAAYNGCTNVLNLLLSKGADIDARDVEGKSCLHWASYNGHSDAVDLLLTSGSDIEGKDGQSMTPLHLAGLLSKGAGIDARDAEGKSALHWAAFNGHTEVVDLLLCNGSDIDAQDNQAMTPLHLCSRSGRESVINLLLSKGADLNAKDDQGMLAVHWASLSGHRNCVELLLLKGCDIETKDGDDMTPLHWAAHESQKNVVDFLLSNGAVPNARDCKGMSALHWAAYIGDIDSANLLLEKGVEIEGKDGRAMTSLALAAHEGYEKIVDLLVSKGSKVNLKGYQNMSALHWAACNGHTQVVDLLLAKGAELEATSDDALTPLHFAAQDGREEVVNLLLARGAAINAKDHQNRTALHWAACNGRKNLVKLLMSKQADISKDNSGLKPLDLAKKNDHVEIVALFTELDK